MVREEVQFKFRKIWGLSALVILIFLSSTLMAESNRSNLFITTVDPTERSQKAFGITHNNETLLIDGLTPFGYSKVQILEQVAKSTLRLDYSLEKSKKLFRLTGFEIVPVHSMYNGAGSTQAGDFNASFSGSGQPAQYTPVSCDPNDLSKYVVTLQFEALKKLVDKTCTPAQSDEITRDLTDLLSVGSAENTCLFKASNTAWIGFQQYWKNKIVTTPSQSFVSCNTAEKKSSFNNGKINMGGDVKWSNSTAAKLLLMHEMLHAEFKDDAQIKPITDQMQGSTCGQFHGLITQADPGEVSKGAQKAPAPKAQSPTNVVYTPMDAQSAPVVHQFAMDNYATATVVSGVVSHASAALAANLNPIPEAQAAIAGVASAEAVSGSVSYDDNGSPTIQLSTGQTYKQPFAMDIPASTITAISHPGTISNETAAGITKQLGAVPVVSSAGEISQGSAQALASGGGGGSAGAGGLSVSARGSAATTVDVSAIKKPSDARAALMKQENPIALLNQPDFKRRLSDLQVQVRYQKQKWGSDKPITKWDLEQMLRARSQQ